jgi:hypothetical protein
VVLTDSKLNHSGEKVENSIFTDKDIRPDNSLLSEAFGEVFAYYSEISDMTKSCKSSWNFAKSSGWIQKTEDKKKALFYLIPLDNAFDVRMTVRESEKTFLLKNKAVSYSHDALEIAKKYSEGYFMSFTVSDEQSFSNCKAFIGEIIKMRLP